jgi:predicted lipoprotein with Yx(FWY)xxD motif
MRLNRLVIGVTAISALSLGLSACGGTGTGSGSSGRYGAASSSASAGTALIHTASMKIGSTTETVLKNEKGLTLYYFTPDSATSVACTGGCAALWPPLISSTGTPASDPALPGTLTTVSAANGNQVAYNGHPLYTYSKDGDAGDAYGQGIGGKWFAATTSLAAAGSSPKPSSTYSPAY